MLLEQLGIALEILPANVDETLPPHLTPEEFVCALSLKKAGAVMAARKRSWVIGADTVVVIGGSILGKPKDRPDAKAMFRSLSGRFHSVFTGFTIGCTAEDRVETQVVESRVKFKDLTEDEINWYAETEEPYDKAGGYAIQGLGSFMVREIQGSYSNVVGLPVCEVVETLQHLNIVQF